MTTREKALVIEDDDALRALLVKLLRTAGYEVVAAEGGLSGLAAFRSHRPRLVVSDLLLPDGMGLTAISTMREEDPEVPILAISGADGFAGKETLLQRALERGATTTLAKPFDASTFTDMIGTLWGQTARLHVDGRGLRWRVWRRRFRVAGGELRSGLLFDSTEGAFFEPADEAVSAVGLDVDETERVIERGWYGEGPAS